MPKRQSPTQLTLVDIRRSPHDNKYAWLPFEPTNSEFTAQWWNRATYHQRDPWFVQVLRDGDEVARIELDTDVHIDHFARTPDLGGRGLEIQFFEVSAAYRLQGIGTAVIEALVAEHPDRRLTAFSEEADGFWASLGWQRFLHATEPDRYRPLFIQP